MSNPTSITTLCRSYWLAEKVTGKAGLVNMARDSETRLASTIPNNDGFIDWLKKQAEAKVGSMHTEHFLSKYITSHPPTLELLNQVSVLANYHYPVLLQGPSGTGKELLANALHGLRSLKDTPKSRFIPVNCTALPGELVESELFGYVRGAFTGANINKLGKFGLADMGTLFLDEIGDMPETTQAKLLRVLEDGTYSPLGSEELHRTTARIVCATNLPLEELVEQRHFRQDLLSRISTFTLKTYPLSERRGDVKLIAEAYKGKELVSKMNLEELANDPFLGNVRTLKSMLDCYHVFNKFKL